MFLVTSFAITRSSNCIKYFSYQRKNKVVVIIIYFETFNCFDKVHDLYQGVGDVFGDLLQRP